MLFFSIITLVAFLNVVYAGWLDDIIGVPACAKACAATLPPGCGSDPTCVCKNKDWMNSAQCCVASKCSTSDQLITQQFAAQLCHYVAQPLQTPTNCPKPTTVAASGAVPTATLAPAGTYPSKLGTFAYQGCYKPGDNNIVIYGVSYLDGAKMTQDLCLSICQPDKYAFMGIAFGNRCFCGSSITLEKSATKMPNDSLCQTKCVANNKQLCGGENYMALYKRP